MSINVELQELLITDALDLKLTHDDYVALSSETAEQLTDHVLTEKCLKTTKLATCIILVQARKASYFLTVSRLLTGWSWLGGHYFAIQRELLRHYLYSEVLKLWKEGSGSLTSFIDDATCHISATIVQERAAMNNAHLSPVFDILQSYFTQFFQDASKSSDISRLLHETISTQFPPKRFSDSFSIWARAILINERSVKESEQPIITKITVSAGDRVIIGSQVSLLTPNGHKLISNAKVANQNANNTYSVCWFDDVSKEVVVEGQVDGKRILTQPVVIATSAGTAGTVCDERKEDSPDLTHGKRKIEEVVEEEEVEVVEVVKAPKSPPLSSRTRSRKPSSSAQSSISSSSSSSARLTSTPPSSFMHLNKRSRHDDDDERARTPNSAQSTPISTPVRTAEKGVSSSCPPGPLPGLPARKPNTLTTLYNVMFNWMK